MLDPVELLQTLRTQAAKLANANEEFQNLRAEFDELYKDTIRLRDELAADNARHLKPSQDRLDIMRPELDKLQERAAAESAEMMRMQIAALGAMIEDMIDD